MKRDRLGEQIAGHRLLDEGDIVRIESLVDSQRLAPVLAAALSQLSRAESDAIRLVVIEGMSTKDAAIVLGSTSVAMRVRISRGKSRLRRELEESFPELCNLANVL
jgi:RNA polymerase sigma-70 factor (ECF subfamily)